jgi:hypothetical protein
MYLTTVIIQDASYLIVILLEEAAQYLRARGKTGIDMPGRNYSG